VLHGVVARAVVLVGVEQANDIGMVELLEDVHLAAKAVDGLLVLGGAGEHDLDGNTLAGLVVDAAINPAHGAGAQFLLDGDGAELVSWLHGVRPTRGPQRATIAFMVRGARKDCQQFSPASAITRKEKPRNTRKIRVFRGFSSSQPRFFVGLLSFFCRSRSRSFC